MDYELFNRRLKNLSAQVDQIQKQHFTLFSGQYQSRVVEQTLREIQSTAEELRSAGAELRNQYEHVSTAQELLAGERQRYLDLFELAPDGYLITNSDGKILKANQAAIRLFGIPRERLIGKPLAVFIALENRYEFRLRTNQLSQPASVLNLEVSIQPRNGRPFEASLTCAARDSGESRDIVLHWLIRDISETKQAQESLRESEMIFRTLAESTSAGIFIVQKQRIRYANTAATIITGFSLNELIGMRFEQLVHADCIEVLGEHGLTKGRKPGRTRGSQVQETLKVTSRCELRLKTKKGVECSVDLTLGEMSYERQSAWLLTAYDITQRNQSEMARKEVLRRLVRVQEEERKRISLELHDQMGQSLTALILGLKSLQDFLPEEPHSGELLKHLHSIADGLGQEVHRLAVELRPASLDDLGLNTTLQNYAEEWSPRSQIEVDYQATGIQDERLPSQIETAIYRIVQEALTNAARHSGATRVSIHLDCRESQVFVIVEDNGCGFDPERVMNLNGAYHLGLLGMKERAELAGGTCHIESSAGNGTTIYVRIPVANDKEDFSE